MTVKELINYLMEQPLNSEIRIDMKNSNDEIVTSHNITGFKHTVGGYKDCVSIECE